MTLRSARISIALGRHALRHRPGGQHHPLHAQVVGKESRVCAVDIAGILAVLSLSVCFFSLASNSCANIVSRADSDANCVAAWSGLTGSITAMTSSGMNLDAAGCRPCCDLGHFWPWVEGCIARGMVLAHVRLGDIDRWPPVETGRCRGAKQPGDTDLSRKVQAEFRRGRVTEQLADMAFCADLNLAPGKCHAAERPADKSFGNMSNRSLQGVMLPSSVQTLTLPMALRCRTACRN